MGGETEKQVSGWTVDTLKAHVDTMMRDRAEHFAALMYEADRRTSANLLALEKSIAIALASADKAGAIYEAHSKQWRDDANEWRGAMSDRERTFVQREMYDAGIGSVIRELNEIRTRIDRRDGKGQGLNAAWGYIIGGIGVVSLVIGIVLKVM